MRATQVDGITADGVIAHGVGVQGWAGVPVQPRFAQAGGDFITADARSGARGSIPRWASPTSMPLRKGYLRPQPISAWTGAGRPVRPVTVSGVLPWSLEEAGSQKRPLQALCRWTEAASSSPTSAARRRTCSSTAARSFAVFSEEAAHEAGAEVVYRLLQPLSLEADFHWLRVEGGHGYRRGRGPRTGRRMGLLRGTSCGCSTSPTTLYLARVFGIRKPRRDITITLDLDAYCCSNDQREQALVVGTLTGGWAFLPNWEAMIATSLGVTRYSSGARSDCAAGLSLRHSRRLPGGFRETRAPGRRRGARLRHRATILGTAPTGDEILFPHQRHKKPGWTASSAKSRSTTQRSWRGSSAQGVEVAWSATSRRRWTASATSATSTSSTPPPGPSGRRA